jgi:hypothetical protein
MPSSAATASSGRSTSAAFENSTVVDLRATTGRYPHDPDLAAQLRQDLSG